MNVRFPDVRRPRSFYDVFGVLAVAVAITALVLAVRYESLVRLQTVAFMALVFLWAGWAIHRMLEESDDRSNREQTPSRILKPR